MSWHGKTREDVEAMLQERLRTCRNQRDELAAELRLLDSATHDSPTNSDGAFAARQARTVTAAIRAANLRYAAALEQFTAFIVDGTLPPEE